MDLSLQSGPKQKLTEEIGILLSYILYLTSALQVTPYKNAEGGGKDGTNTQYFLHLWA